MTRGDLIELALVLVGAGFIVAGVALLSTPAALITCGVVILVIYALWLRGGDQ